eukprot:TRINITY_DN10685_c0_g1_i1.p1 TRINITY_DN10685_c0_g1~~TRINITY_DN10685_c0_g1_i1.p1  ORF type:complete len:266 (+),score=-3.14 TRINITY_DN10685_c0_g1_i1:43-840(+)
MDRGICRFFLQGIHCRYGNDCRYLHCDPNYDDDSEPCDDYDVMAVTRRPIEEARENRSPRSEKYDQKIFVDQKKVSEFVCCVCLDITTDLKETKECGHFLCSECYSHLDRCPLDNIPTKAYPVSKFIVRKIKELKVRCSQNCCWEGEFGQLDSHLLGCPKSTILCEACEQSVQKLKYEDHKKSSTACSKYFKLQSQRSMKIIPLPDDVVNYCSPCNCRLGSYPPGWRIQCDICSGIFCSSEIRYAHFCPRFNVCSDCFVHVYFDR